MKCLLVADLHYDLRKFDWVVAAAAHVDVVVLAGDHLDAFSTVDRAAQSIVVQKYFRRIRGCAPLLVCSGNHDLDTFDARGEYTTRWITQARYYDVPNDGDSRLIEGALFSICPWHHSRLGWTETARHLARDGATKPTRWIWVHHAPPKNSPTSWNGHRSFGDAALRGWINKHHPDIVLSGHVHQAPFTPKGSWADRIGRTWVFNAGHQIGPLPSHVVVDTDLPGAYWISLMGGEMTLLDRAFSQPFEPITEPPAWLRAMARSAARPQAESSHPVGV